MKKLFSITLSAFAIVLSTQAVAQAQTAPRPQAPAQGSGQALEIGPPVINLAGNPGETVRAQISLRDVSPNKLIVNNEINDFVAAGEDGTPKLLLKKDEVSPYSIKSWISPLPRFTLVPRQVQTLTVNVKIPNNAAPGGYYGVIRFTGTPPELEGTGVSLSASLGSLVLLRVNGDVKEEVVIEEFYTANGSHKTGLFEYAPVTFVERLNNKGNIHEQPTGQIVITDMFGKTLTSVKVNDPPRNILPRSIRKFEQTLKSEDIDNKFLFGKYTAKLELIYGGSAETLTMSHDFWVIPYRLIAAIIAGIVALIAIIYFAFRAYAKRVLNQSGRGRRR